jgi:hypothetical protein
MLGSGVHQTLRRLSRDLPILRLGRIGCPLFGRCLSGPLRQPRPSPGLTPPQTSLGRICGGQVRVKVNGSRVCDPGRRRLSFLVNCWVSCAVVRRMAPPALRATSPSCGWGGFLCRLIVKERGECRSLGRCRTGAGLSGWFCCGFWAVSGAWWVWCWDSLVGWRGERGADGDRFGDGGDRGCWVGDGSLAVVVTAIGVLVAGFGDCPSGAARHLPKRVWGGSVVGWGA